MKTQTCRTVNAVIHNYTNIFKGCETLLTDVQYSVIWPNDRLFGAFPTDGSLGWFLLFLVTINGVAENPRAHIFAHR